MITTNQNLKELIAKGKTEKTIEQLLKLLPQLDKDLQEDILMQSAKFTTYQKEKHQGTASNEELDIKLNRINNALLEIIHQLPQESQVIARNFKRNAFKWASGLAAIIAFLAGVAELSGYSLRDLFFTKEETTELQDQKQHLKDSILQIPPVTDLKDEVSKRVPVKTQLPKNSATTSGKNSPSVVNTGENSDVNISYGNVDPFEESDTSKIKKDSLQ